jgi:hypothetical protein
MFSYQIDGQILTLTVSGYPMPADRLALFDAVQVDSRVPLGALLILDVRSLPVDLSEAAAIERLGILISLLGPKLGPACAIIRGAHGNDSHTFQTTARGHGLQVALFLDEHAARQWLNTHRNGHEWRTGRDGLRRHQGIPARVHGRRRHGAGEYGVRANCVCPGPIDTAWTHKDTGAVDATIEKSLITSVPFGRRGTPEEAAKVYAFLASDAASFVTGALWMVDGGLTQSKGAVGAMASKKGLDAASRDDRIAAFTRWHAHQRDREALVGA